MMWSRLERNRSSNEDGMTHDSQDNNDDYSDGSYEGSTASSISLGSKFDRAIDNFERRSGLKWYQMSIIIWAMTAIFKNLGIGRHIHLDPIDNLDGARVSTRRTKENDPNRRRIALVRPFAPGDAEMLLESLEQWDVVKPCGAVNKDEKTKTWVDGNGYYEYGENFSEEDMPVVDFVLSYSRTYGDTDGFDTFRSVKEIFESRDGWGCFSELVAIESGIEPEFDLYLPSAIQTNPMWVNGPNQQFIKSYEHAKDLGYDAMVLMEGDVQPQVNGWLDLLLSEVKRNEPFALLGSKYDGHSWDNFRDEMPPALLDHLNGNAIYNITHPLLENIISELKKEKDTYFNAIPYDYRISQMWTEGSKGIPPNFPYKEIIDESTGQPVVLPTKTKLFRSWYNKYGEEQPMKETHVVTNFGATNFLPQQVEGVPLVHGKGVYSPHEPKKHKITLVVSDWDMDYAKHLLEVIDHNRHPFSEVLVMRDGLPNSILSAFFGEGDKLEGGKGVKTSNVRYVERAAPDFMDLCEAPVETEYFMITNAYHRVAPDINIMFTPENDVSGVPGRPLIPFTPSETEYCNEYPACRETLNLGREIYRDLDKIVLDFDMIYQTSARNDFCAFWKTAHGPNGALLSSRRKFPADLQHILRGPSATSFVAYLYSIGVADTIYAFSDKTMHGSSDVFVKVLEEDEQLNHHLHLKGGSASGNPRDLKRCASVGEQSKACGSTLKGIPKKCCTDQGLECDFTNRVCTSEVQYNTFGRNRRYVVEAPSFLVGK